MTLRRLEILGKVIGKGEDKKSSKEDKKVLKLFLEGWEKRRHKEK